MRETVDTFIALAREDLAVARKVVDEFPRDAAFHIEQAAEKLLKAVLTTQGIKFGVGHHQIGRLADLLPPDHVWRADMMAFDVYTSYATATRYPRPGGGMPGTPSKNVLKAGIADVSSLVGEIQDWCNEKFSDSPHLKR
jgi:HEPN domain-containing protein